MSPGNLTGAFTHGAPVATTPDIVTTVVSAAVEPGAGADGAGVDVAGAGVALVLEVEEPSPQPASTSARDTMAVRDRTLDGLYTAAPLCTKPGLKMAGNSDLWMRRD